MFNSKDLGVHTDEFVHRHMVTGGWQQARTITLQIDVNVQVDWLLYGAQDAALNGPCIHTRVLQQIIDCHEPLTCASGGILCIEQLACDHVSHCSNAALQPCKCA